MLYQLTHITEYKYDDRVSYCHNMATLKPREFEGQALLEYALQIYPKPSELSERIDFFGNQINSFSIQEPHKQLRVISKSKVTRDRDLIANGLIEAKNKQITVEAAKSELQTLSPEILEARQFVLESPLIRKISPLFRQYSLESFKPERPLFDASFELMQRIYADFEFVTGYTDIATPINEVMEEKKGVCQDFAQIAIACIRSVGIPARYTSGYIETIPPEGKEKLIGADASHAWFSVFIPTIGWIDFDPTNNILPVDQHITVAWGRDYYDVAPLKGVIFSNGRNTMKVSVDMQPVNNKLFT